MNEFPGLIDFTVNSQNKGATITAFETYSRCFQSGAKYIAMLEGDDFWDDPHKLQKQVDFLEAHSEISLVWHDYDIVDEVHQKLDPQPSKGYLRHYSSSELKQITSIKTLTVCYRNVVREMPKEYLRCPNGDTFLFAMLGQFGGAAFLENISPAKYRIHKGGMWGAKKLRHRDLLAIKSYIAIAQYFMRQNDHTTMLYYIDRYVKTQYLFCYEDRSRGLYLPMMRITIQTIKTIIKFNLYKTLPYIVKQFIRIILFGVEIKWDLRQPNSTL
jgi:hypothetical protein